MIDKSIDLIEMGKRIKIRRAIAEITQDELGEFAGLNVSTNKSGYKSCAYISYLERGKREHAKIDDAIIEKIAKVLQCPKTYLMYDLWSGPYKHVKLESHWYARVRETLRVSSAQNISIDKAATAIAERSHTNGRILAYVTKLWHYDENVRIPNNQNDSFEQDIELSVEKINEAEAESEQNNEFFGDDIVNIAALSESELLDLIVIITERLKKATAQPTLF